MAKANKPLPEHVLKLWEAQELADKIEGLEVELCEIMSPIVSELTRATVYEMNEIIKCLPEGRIHNEISYLRNKISRRRKTSYHAGGLICGI